MQSGASFRLVVRRGPQPNQVFELTRDTITIGRDITNDITINDPEVSRHHSRMIRTGTGYTIEDLRSTNNTFVNRQRVTGPYALSHGDMIGMGETVTLSYEAVGVPGGVATVVGAGAAPAAAQPAQAPAYAPPPAYSPPPVVMPVADEVQRPEGRGRTMAIVIGVGIVVCICAFVVGAVVFDQFNLYCTAPFNQFFACP
jgi:predicted component of type VI protein secretion system